MALLQAVALLVGLVSSEKLVWSEEFDNLDESVWLHEVTTFPQVQFQAEPRVSNDQIQEENCIFNWGRNNCELCSTHRRSSSTLGTTATIPGFTTESFMSRKTVLSYTNTIMALIEIKLILIDNFCSDVRLTSTADTYGEDFLEHGELDLFEEDPDHPCNVVR